MRHESWNKSAYNRCREINHYNCKHWRLIYEWAIHYNWRFSLSELCTISGRKKRKMITRSYTTTRCYSNVIMFRLEIPLRPARFCTKAPARTWHSWNSSSLDTVVYIPWVHRLKKTHVIGESDRVSLIRITRREVTVFYLCLELIILQ